MHICLWLPLYVNDALGYIYNTMAFVCLCETYMIAVIIYFIHYGLLLVDFLYRLFLANEQVYESSVILFTGRAFVGLFHSKHLARHCRE